MTQIVRITCPECRGANTFTDLGVPSPFSHELGVATRSQYRLNPPLHVLRLEGSDWRTWCTGAPALQGVVHLEQQTCAECKRLLREEAQEYADDACPRCHGTGEVEEMA